MRKDERKRKGLRRKTKRISGKEKERERARESV